MSIKMIALAAVTVAASASMASANNSFAFGEYLDGSDVLELGTITTESAAVVEIYDYRLGTQGELLGMENLMAGANTQVKVGTGLPAAGDVLAVLKIDGAVVATKQYDIR